VVPSKELQGELDKKNSQGAGADLPLPTQNKKTRYPNPKKTCVASKTFMLNNN